ncbi:MAG TPA: glycosyltransferase, partial [Steroidobacteraceae bacterium]|nr:glycosyltransferase [Steroidobacteraceae bacterium]
IHTKGLDVLLEGFERAARAHSMHLTMQGPDWDGELATLTKLITSLQITDKVKKLPPNYDLPATRVLADYDIICIPSRFEGFGLAALEAMLAGRVLMIAASAGIAPHVERSGCGVTVEPHATDIHLGFERLLARRAEWREMGLRGREYALDHLHWDGIARRTLTQYQQLLN